MYLNRLDFTCVENISCPSGTFAKNATNSTTINVCEKCLNNLNLCDPISGLSNSTILNQTCTSLSCLVCNATQFISPEGLCLNICPVGFFGFEGRCQSCNSADRMGVTECFVDQFGKIIPLSCDKGKGFYLHNGICKSENVDGYFKDDLTGWFVKCDCSCKTCAKSP